MANKYSQAKNFKFVGYITFKEDNLLKTKDGSSWRKLSFGITDGNNSQYVEVNEFGAGNTFKVKSPNEDGGYDDLEIMWHESKDESVLENVASFSKKYVLGETLIHNHDVIESTYKAIKEGKLTSAKFEDGKVVSGTKISVSGQIKFNYYNGNVNQVYEFSRISIVKEETPCEFTGTISLVFGNKAVKIYSALVVVAIVIGSTLNVDFVWSLSDMFNGLMVIPNLLGVLALSKVVSELTKEHDKRK